MNLTIDIGNSTTKYAIFDRFQIVHSGIIESMQKKFFATLLNKFSITSIIVSSVGELLSKDIVEMIEALDKVTPGIAADETLMYGVEVKFYSNKVVVNRDFETSIKGLRAIGDGAGVTRGLQQASANGISVARSILRKLDQE